MATLEELTARLEALEAIAAPRAAVPPITIGELTDVPAPGSPIASAWAQEVTNRAVHRFATKAALDAWTAADGSLGYVTANKAVYVRMSGVWVNQFQRFPPSTTVPLSTVSFAGTALQVATMTIAAVAWNRTGLIQGSMLANFATSTVADQVALGLQWFGAPGDNQSLAWRTLSGTNITTPLTPVNLSAGVGGTFNATAQRVGGATATAIVDGLIRVWLFDNIT